MPATGMGFAYHRSTAEMNMSAYKSMFGSDADDTTVIRDLELQDWAKELGTSRKELADAVGLVGHNAEAVRAHLQHRSDPAGHKPST
jgi:hypothetical protein